MATKSTSDLTPIIRQRNPSGRVTYYTPSRGGMQRITRPRAMYLVDHGEAFFAGDPHDRIGGAGDSLTALMVNAITEGELSIEDVTA